MAKSVSKATQRDSNQMRVTVRYGYGLLGTLILGIIATVASFIPSQEWQNPQDASMVAFTFAFMISVFAPPFIGYATGAAATNKGDALVRRYNGVLFGVLAVGVWVVALSGMSYIGSFAFLDSNLDALLLNLSPVVITAAAVIPLGVAYATRHAQGALVSYRPYRWTLYGVAAFALISAGTNALYTQASDIEKVAAFFTALIIPTLVLLGATVVGYWALGRRSGEKSVRITKSLVAVGLAMVAMIGVSQAGWYAFRSYPDAAPYVLYGVILLGWVSYLIFMRRAAR